MKTLASDSYNVAWFKLADFIARGEKERALSVHKLLMHSVTDLAFAYQLEGDILLAFEDEGAIEKYHAAANVYKKQGKIKSAIAVYEHVAVFQEDEHVLEALLDMHAMLHDKDGVLDTFARLANVCLKKGELGFILHRLHTFLAHEDQKLLAHLHARFVVALLLHEANDAQIKTYTEQTLTMMQALDDDRGIQEFMAKVKALSQRWYECAQHHIMTQE